jgi:hypothetical protein
VPVLWRFPCSDFFMLLLRSLDLGRAVLEQGPQEEDKQIDARELMDRSAVRLPDPRPAWGLACASQLDVS